MSVNDFLLYAGFVFLSVLFYLPSFWVRFAWSGGGISLARFLLVAGYNCFFIVLHVDFAKTGQIPFVGVYNNLAMQWFSFFIVLADVFSMPGAKKKVCWLARYKS